VKLSQLSRPSPVVFIFLTIFVDFMGGTLLVPILPFLVERFRSDALTIGLLGASFSLAQFVAAPGIGALSDRYGRRPVLLMCMLGTSLGYLIFGLANALWLLFLGRIVDGITGGVISTAQAYIADISKPEDRSKNFGLIGAAFGLGFILGPAIGGALSQIDLNLPVFLAAGLALANTILGYFTLPESLPKEKRQQGKLQSIWSELNPIGQLGNIARDKNIRALVFGFFLFNFAFAGFQNNFAVFTRDQFQWDPVKNAQLFAYIGVVSSLVQGGLIRKLIPRFGEEILALWGLAFCGISVFAVAFLPAANWLYVTQTLFALGVGLASPTLRGLISARTSAQEQGRALGGAQSLVSLSMVLGPLWAGSVYDSLGYTAPYWTSGLWIAVALGVTAFALKSIQPVAPYKKTDTP
jgi:MFS transporter, DHA1 family, tetracycline resistance protein